MLLAHCIIYAWYSLSEHIAPNTTPNPTVLHVIQSLIVLTCFREPIVIKYKAGINISIFLEFHRQGWCKQVQNPKTTASIFVNFFFRSQTCQFPIWCSLSSIYIWSKNFSHSACEKVKPRWRPLTSKSSEGKQFLYHFSKIIPIQFFLTDSIANHVFSS